MAYLLLDSLRRSACRLFKIGTLVTIRVRRVKLAMASGCPYQAVFAAAHRALGAA